MCGRYYVEDDLEDEIRKVLEASQADVSLSGPHDVFPSMRAAVILGDRDRLRCKEMPWGFPNPRGKGLLINARAETVMEKKLFRDSIRRCRCVIPASGFYEWDRDRNRVTFFNKEKSPLWFAGFYDLFDNTDRFIILTTAANASMQPVHDRMPCILARDRIGDWIRDDRMIEALISEEPPELSRFQEYRQESLF